MRSSPGFCAALATLAALGALAACERGTLQGSVDSGGPFPRDGGSGDGAADGLRPPDAILDVPADLAIDLRADVPFPTDAADTRPADARDGGPTDARDGGPTGDAAADGLRVTGQRSFVVDATFSPATDAGTIGPSLNGQSFTMVIDADVPVAVVGNALGHTPVAVTTSDGRGFGVTSAFTLGASAGCSATVNYTALNFTIDAGGNLTGIGRARVFVLQGDVGTISEVTVSLSGRPDGVAPTLSGSGTTVDPLQPLTLRASEPLPATTRLALAAGTDVIQLGSTPSMAPLSAVSAFGKPNVVLRWGTIYTVALDGFRDFAGNLGTTGAQFEIRTIAAPDAAAEDGFESATGTTLGGARLISGAGMPVLTGGKSLYAGTALTTALGDPGSLALRLPVAAGDRFIRFSYQRVAASSNMSLSPTTLLFGLAGGPPGSTTIPSETAPLTPFALPNGATIYLGAKSTAEIALPANAVGEVVIERPPLSPVCGLPPPPPPGLLIDDLRVEP